MEFNQVPIFHVDITLTDNCNFSCKYCFEKGNFNTNSFQDVDLFITKMDQLLNSSFFNNNYQILNIGFWGGEPTLNSDVIKTIVDTYSKNNKVKFYLFSNGYDIESVLDLLISYKDNYLIGGHPKFCIQMSYDGGPIHDINRTLRNGKTTSTVVRRNILALDKLRIPYTIKSTVTLSTFKYLHLSYEDILDIWNSRVNEGFRNSRFFPTIDYYNLEKHTDLELNDAKLELEDSLIKIAKLEIDYFRKHKQFFFAWFNNNKALCSAGRDMVAIHLDGTVYKCHGCFYDNNKDHHVVTNLKNSDFIQKIEESNNFHSTDFGFLPIECKNCDVNFCLKCNSVKFSRSNKEEYLDKWRDYPVQKTLCDFYYINSNVLKAINQILKEN